MKYRTINVTTRRIYIVESRIIYSIWNSAPKCNWPIQHLKTNKEIICRIMREQWLYNPIVP